MGRFARSNDKSKAQAKLEAPRAGFRSWRQIGQRRDLPLQKRNITERKAFKLFSLVLLLIIGASSGWMIGRFFIGTSQSNIIQPAAMVERLPGSEVVAHESQLDANKNVAAPVETAGENEKASAKRSSGDDREKTDSVSTARESSSSAQPAPVNSGSKAGRRYAKGGGFQPTTIVIKPAKVISKPFKKINPFKKIF